jgi:hypothetical protein
MPLYKFGDGDLFYNQIKAHPSSSFFINDSKIYYNNKATEPGAFVANATNVPVGHISLFEYNVDRAAASDKTLVVGPSSSISSSWNVPDTGIIYPYISKGNQKIAFKGIKRADYIHNYNAGDIITGSYQLSSSITRQRYQGSHNFLTTNHTGSALKNSLSYAARLGDHYNVDDSGGVNIIQIPSIFYGSEIKKGTVDLKFYITGTIAAQLQDTRRNGALRDSNGTQGVVLYKEGIIILTGSTKLARLPAGFCDKDVDGDYIIHYSSWLNFGLGYPQMVPEAGYADINPSASFSLDFAGTHKIPTVTMLAHANKGELNYSNNLTYVSASQSIRARTGSYAYVEPENIIKNIHSASYADPSGSLVKTTYITKIGIYDEKKKLIGIASLAKPVKKTENRDLTFKLKLDI